MSAKKQTLEQLRREVADRISGHDEDNAVITRKNKYRDLHKVEHDHIALAKKMAKVRAKKDKLDDELKEINAEYDVLRIELMPTLMEDRGLGNFVVKGLGRVQVAADIFCSIKGGQQEAMFEWARGENPDKEDLSGWIKEKIEPSTLKAAIKDRLKTGKPVPDEFLNVTLYQRASIVKV